MVTKKTIRKLKRKGWRFRIKWSKEYQGLCQYGKKRLTLNPYKVLASVIIHEAIHVKHPKFPEEVVLGWEAHERYNLTLKRAKGIVKAFCPDIYKALSRR